MAVLMLAIADLARVVDTSPPGPRELIWRVKTEKGILFLMGSIHALAPADHPLRPRYGRVFLLADQFAFEIDLDEANGQLTQDFIATRGRYSNGGSIRSALSPAAYGKLQNLAIANNAAPNAFDSYRPWVASSVVENYQIAAAGLEPEWGVEQIFFNQAKALSKPRFYLETATSQLEALAAVPESEYVTTITEQLEDGTKHVTELADAWRNSDVARLTDIVETERLASPGQYKSVIYDRNLKFTARAEEFLNQPRSTLMIVGVAHLVGRDGVLQALKDRGYNVVQLPASPPVAEPITLTYSPTPGRTLLFESSATPTLAEGGALVLSGSGSGDGPFSYQWQKDGEPLEGGATNRFSRTEIRAEDSGAYSLRIDSEFGTTFSPPFVVNIVRPAAPRLSIRRVRNSVTLTSIGTTNATYRIEQAEQVTGPWTVLTNLTQILPEQGLQTPASPHPRFFRAAY